MERSHNKPIELGDLARQQEELGERMLPAVALVHAVDATGMLSISIYDAPERGGIEAIAMGATGSQQQAWRASINREEGIAAFCASVVKAGPGALALVDKRFPREIEIGVPANNYDPDDWCLNLHKVRYLHSHLAPNRRRLVCVYAAADLEAVVSAYRLIPVDVSRIFRATVAPALKNSHMEAGNGASRR